MANHKHLGILLASILGGCHPPASTAPHEVGRPRLVPANGRLYITGVPPGNKRGTIFVVHSHETIPGGFDRVRVGLVQGVQTHDDSLEVTELCHIPKRERGALATSGLPVEPLREDTRARVGNCMAQYTLRHPGGWDRSLTLVDLTLDVGLADGVREHDRYEVQGEPFVDSLNRTVIDFYPLGYCTVQEPIASSHATCRLDKHQWPDFTRERAMIGGSALLKPMKPMKPMLEDPPGIHAKAPAQPPAGAGAQVGTP